MRRLLPIVLLVCVLGALGASVAWARSGAPSTTSHGPALASDRVDAFEVPEAAPPVDPASADGVHGYVTAARLGAALDRAERRDAEAPSASTGGSITVTARVLPGIVATFDAGDLVRVETNTPERDAHEVMFVIRGATLDAAAWAQLRAALVEARAGTGLVWHR